jgi:hypothetical protein
MMATMASYQRATLNGVAGEARARFQTDVADSLHGSFTAVGAAFEALADVRHPVVFEGVAFEDTRRYRVVVPVRITRAELPRFVHFEAIGTPSVLEPLDSA